MEIVPASATDFNELAALYDRYAFAMRLPEWLRWKYEHNPYGSALSFKVLQDGQLVGTASVQPRLYRYQGREITGIQLVDGLLCEEVRGKKYFRQLTGFLLRQTPPGSRSTSFHYTVPSIPASVKACANAGLHTLGVFELFTCVIDPGVVRRVKGVGWMARFLRPFWRSVQGAWFSGASRGVSVEEIRRFDQDMTPLYTDDRVHGDRSAPFLNWRVFENPRDHLRAFLLRENDKIVGFLVCKETGHNLEIMDLQFATPHPRFLAAFLRHVASLRTAEIVDCGLLPGHPYRALLRKVGFVRRRSGRGVFYVFGHDLAGLLNDPSLWDVNYLDSDW